MFCGQFHVGPGLKPAEAIMLRKLYQESTLSTVEIFPLTRRTCYKDGGSHFSQMNECEAVLFCSLKPSIDIALAELTNADGSSWTRQKLCLCIKSF